MLSAHAAVDVGKHAAVHAAFQSEVEHHLFVAVVNAGDTAQVALLVVGLDAVYDGRGQVLDGCLRVAGHELLAVDLDFLHLLAVDLDVSFIIDLGAGELLYQLLDNRAFRGAVGTRIIYDSIVFGGHFSHVLHHLCAFQHHGIGADGKRTHLHGIAPADGDVLIQRLVAHVGDTHDVGSVFGCRQLELSVSVGYCIGSQGAVLALQQGYRSLDYGFFLVIVNHATAHGALGLHGEGTRQAYCHQ